jgi:hypothetical protein
MLKPLGYGLVLYVLSLACASAHGQQPTNTRCDFAIFNKELMGAIEGSDAGKVALLVNYPLRINDARGTYYIRDAASLQGRLGEIFTPPVRAAVSTQKLDTSDCHPDRFMYGRGDVWVELTDQGYAITAVNVPDSGGHPPDAARVRVTCRTDKLRIIVDTTRKGIVRYRAWNEAHSLSQEPDAELMDGKETIEGTGACVHHIWWFSQGEKQFSIQGLGCDENPPPANATGQLVTASGTTWCF